MSHNLLFAIILLDKEHIIYSIADRTKVISTMSLRQNIYKFLKLANGHSLFGKMHQEPRLSAMEIRGKHHGCNDEQECNRVPQPLST